MIHTETPQPDSQQQTLPKRLYGLPGLSNQESGLAQMSELRLLNSCQSEECNIEPLSPTIMSPELSVLSISSTPSSSPSSTVSNSPIPSRPGTPPPRSAMCEQAPSSPLAPVLALSTNGPLYLRRFRPEDQESIETIGELCYPPNLEDNDSFLAKLYVGDSFVAVDSTTGAIAAYCIGLPWHKEPLHINESPTLESFEGADVYVVHDVAVHPDRRGGGVAGLLLDQLLTCARDRKLTKAVLVAINPTARMVWSKKGFSPMSCQCDSGYGATATKMEMYL